MRKLVEVLGLFVFIAVTLILVMAGCYALNGLVVAHAHDAGFIGGLCDFLASFKIINIIVLMLVFVMVIATLLTLAERKWSAMMQDRVGPNRARLGLPGVKNRALGGLPHVLADSLKMLFKEDHRPEGADKVLFALGPILAFAPVFALFAVVPAGPSVNVFGAHVDMWVSNPNFGVLFLFAIASLAVYGTSLAGWSSNNKLALLGGVRAASQMISYEVALGLGLVGMMVAFGTVRLPDMSVIQGGYLWMGHLGSFDIGLPKWGILLQPLGFVLFFAAAMAETKRAPFDLPEGESEIIGYFIEYSGMKFGMFMISEFVEVVVLSAVCTAIFFGGWQLPVGGEWLASHAFFVHNGWALGALLGAWFWVKVVILCWVQLAIRWTFPRFRYDQIMNLGWKILLPAGLVNVFATAALVIWDPSLRALAVLGIVEIAVVVALTVTRKAPATQPATEAAHGQGGDSSGHAAPVPATQPAPSDAVLSAVAHS